MSAKAPVIKFSPFEALFIGEKNRILKQQPMKNTIFFTKLNQKSKNINLRVLFDLEKNTNTKNNDVTFKIPQRVCDFLKHRVLQNEINKSTNHENDEILCYEFEGQKVITEYNKTLLPKAKKTRLKPIKLKFKQRFKYKDNIKDKIVKKFPNPICKRNYCSACDSFAFKRKKRNSKGKKYFLRNRGDKFMYESEFETSESEEISPKQKYLSNYLHQLYLKKNKQLFSNIEANRNENSLECEMPYSVKSTIGLPNLQFDINASEALLNEISRKYYENNCCEDFQLPKFPNNLKAQDFENDNYLIDIIYENFPKIVKFDNQTQMNDFSDALIDSGLLKPEKYMKIYEKKKNDYIKNEEIREIFDRCFPLIKLRRIDDIMPNHFSLKNGKNLYSNGIDEPYTEKDHLISDKSFGSFFFRSTEKKDIFIGNLMKPFLQNSWFGRLPES